MAVTALCLMWSARSASNQPDLFHMKDDGNSLAAPLDESSDDGTEGRDAVSASRDTGFSLQWFHFIMAMCPCLLAIMLTDWAGRTIEGNTPFWVQGSACLTSILLYGWTLVAPSVFPDREF